MNQAGDNEAERIVLAHYLVHRKSHIRDATVQPDTFQHGKHREWWEKAVSARTGWTPGDLGITTDDAALLAGIRTSPRIALEAERRMISRWQVRFVQRQCGEMAKSIAQGEMEGPDQVLAGLREMLGDAEAGGVTLSRTHREVGVERFREWYDNIKAGTSAMIPTPIGDLNRKMSGWKRGKLYLVGAVTSGHKTTFARMSAWHAAKEGYRSLVWTMEDDAAEMAARTFAQEVPHVNTRTFTTDKRPEVGEGDFAAMLTALGGHLDDEASQRLRYLDEAMPKLSRVLALLSAEAARGLDFVALDFMQLIQPDGSWASTNETQHWFLVSNSLAAAAKRLNIPIVATVQPTQLATREQERHHKPLTKGDMRGGSAIAQAAYGLLLFNRVWDDEGNLDKRFIDLHVAKMKNAETQTMRYRVVPHRDVILED